MVYLSRGVAEEMFGHNAGDMPDKKMIDLNILVISFIVSALVEGAPPLAEKLS